MSNRKQMPEDLILKHRHEAEMILVRLRDMVHSMGWASLHDLYDLVGVIGSYTDRSWGWSDVDSASIERVRDDWKLALPDMEEYSGGEKVYTFAYRLLYEGKPVSGEQGRWRFHVITDRAEQESLLLHYRTMFASEPSKHWQIMEIELPK